MEERINQLSKELAAKRRSTNWSSNLSLIIGMLLILLLCGYFGYGYYMFDDITNPKTIVASAKSYLEDLSVEARRTAGEEVRKSAPIWAQQASTELVANMPSFREKAEITFNQYFDEQVEKTKELTRSEFANIVENNRGDFQEAIDTLVQRGKSDEFVAKIMPIIEQQYATDMKTQVSNVLGGLQFINQQLDKLSTGQDLNPIEQQQRYILGLTRLMRE
jgi:hypothetical protein